MARTYPTRLGDFGRISGVGQQKLNAFGEVFVAEVNQFLLARPRRNFAPPASPPELRLPLNDSAAETLARFQRGESPDEIARARGLTDSTISGHLTAAMERGEALPRDRFFTAEQKNELEAAFRESDGITLKLIYNSL